MKQYCAKGLTEQVKMRISVNADNREYNVHIGPGMINEEGLFSGLRRAAVVTDETVARLHLDALLGTLERAGVEAGSIILPPGEEIKSRDRLFDIYSGLADSLIGRSDAVIAFGGGTVGDAAGFAAATYRRGVPLIQCPTTLLAQADSSIGGKVAIDHPRGKNLIGAFYQPTLVVTDTALLSTLPREHIASGMAEVIKCAALSSGDLGDVGGDMTGRVYGAAMIKAGYVQADPKDIGIRRELNFGHTIGHALERASGFELLHGYGVSIGMAAMARIGEDMGITEPGTAERLTAALRAAELPTELKDIDEAAFRAAMLLDKKGDGESVNAVFLKKLGQAAIVSTPIRELCDRALSPAR